MGSVALFLRGRYIGYPAGLMADTTPPPGGHADDLESTTELLRLAGDGDRRAIERLCARYLPRLNRWARGRLPDRSRDLLDTGDVVQEVLLRTVKHLEGFTPETHGGFNAYLRQAITNRIRDELRRKQRTPEITTLDAEPADPGLTPLEVAIGRDQAARYELALRKLRDEDREAVVARIEMQCSYEEIAQLLGKPTTNAARMTVMRAVERLARAMEADAR